MSDEKSWVCHWDHKDMEGKLCDMKIALGKRKTPLRACTSRVGVTIEARLVSLKAFPNSINAIWTTKKKKEHKQAQIIYKLWLKYPKNNRAPFPLPKVDNIKCLLSRRTWMWVMTSASLSIRKAYSEHSQPLPETSRPRLTEQLYSRATVPAFFRL